MMRLKDARRYPRHWYERARYGVSSRDSWSLGSHVLLVLERGCRQLRERGGGHPAAMETMDEWRTVLAQIEAGCNAGLVIYGDRDGDEYDPDLDTAACFDRGMELLARHLLDLWD